MRRLFARAVLAFAALLAASAPLRAEVFYGVEANGIWSVDVNLGGPATQLTTFAAPLTSAATLATRPSDGMLFYLESQNANPTLWRWNPATPAVAPVLIAPRLEPRDAMSCGSGRQNIPARRAGLEGG